MPVSVRGPCYRQVTPVLQENVERARSGTLPDSVD